MNEELRNIEQDHKETIQRINEAFDQVSEAIQKNLAQTKEATERIKKHLEEIRKE